MSLDVAQDSPRSLLFRQLEPTAWPDRGLSPVNIAICGLILASVTLAILETEPLVVSGYEPLLVPLEWLFVGIFAVEYGARVWASAADPRYGPGLVGRLRYMRSPAAVIDLLALASVATSFGGDAGFLLRLARIIRIFRLARLGRLSPAMQHVSAAFASRRYELAVSFAAGALLIVLSSSLLYLAEGAAQPEEFGSIPRAMWWAVATLTTVGYGDVYPITLLGRVFAALTAINGIGMIAMPAGILAAAFSDALQHKGSE
jgi:voltage-gated potassium channel